MTDRDPEDRKKGARKPSALDQIARMRAGLQEGPRGPDRLSSSDAIRRARDAFGDSNDGRVAGPRFGAHDDGPREDEPHDEDWRAGSRDAPRLGDADAGEDGSLVRAMLRDIKPAARAEAETDRRRPYGARSGGYDNAYDDGPDADRYPSAPDDAERAYDDPYDADADARYDDAPPDDDYGYDEPIYEDEAYTADPYPPYDAASDYRDRDRASAQGDLGGRSLRDTLSAGAASAGGLGRAPALEADQAPDLDKRGGRRSKRGRGARAERADAATEAPRREGRRGGGGGEPAPHASGAIEHATPPSGRPPAPFGALERMLAGRYLRARRKEGFISVIALLSLVGVTLGVAVLIVVMSVMNGFRTELVDKIIGLDGHISVKALERDEIGRLRYAYINNYEAVALEAGDIDGVFTAPIVESATFVTGRRGDGAGAGVRGISQRDFLLLEPVSQAPEESLGSPLNFGAARSVAVGSELARQLGVTVGDQVTLLSSSSVSTPFGRSPRRRVFNVVYIFKAGYYEYDSTLIFMPIDQAQDFFGVEGAATSIEIKVATPEELDQYREAIAETLGDNFEVRDWKQNRGSLVGALETEQSVMFFILSMLILIASLVIISGLIMLVKEKGPGIAILRTMGLSRAGVMRVFFMCGAMIGVVGTALGAALGVVVALNIAEVKNAIEETLGVDLFPNNIYFLSELPSRLDWGDVGFTVALALSISLLATLYPARKAARLDPVEGLRNG